MSKGPIHYFTLACLIIYIEDLAFGEGSARCLVHNLRIADAPGPGGIRRRGSPPSGTRSYLSVWVLKSIVMYYRGEDALLRTHHVAATACYEKGQEAMLVAARFLCFYESCSLNVLGRFCEAQ